MQWRDFGSGSTDPPAADNAANGAPPSRNRAEIVPKSALLRIGTAEADLARGTVRAPDGTVTELRRQSAGVLRFLAAHRGTNVGRDALHAAVWGHVAVTDDSLVQCIGDIRRALGSARDALRTVPREGYRLETGPPPAERTAPRKGWRPLAAASAALVVVAGLLALALATSSPPPEPAGAPVVAVLPFANGTGGDRWDRLAQGVTEEVIADLGRNDWIFVYAAAATRPYAGATPQALGTALAADVVVTGSVQAEGKRVRISAALADAGSGRQVWAESREGPADDLLALQTSAAEALVAELAGGYTGAIARAGRARAHDKTGSLAAYDLYLLGTEHKHRFTRADMALARDYYRRAVALDPGFARAWVGLAIAEGFLYGYAMTGDEAAEHDANQRVAVERAMAADPDDPAVLLESSRLFAMQGDLVAAERAIRQAVERAPNDADILAVASWSAPERSPITTEAIAWADRALALNPTRPDWYLAAKGEAMYAAGDDAGAIAVLRQGPKDYLDGWLMIAGAAAALGDEATVREATGEVHRISPDFDLDRYFDGWPWEPTFRDRFRAGVLRAGLGGSGAEGH